MIHYPHFALSNIYLTNGFKEVNTKYGTARSYENQDELEQCIRRLLIRKPTSLRGCDLRFLRQGLELTQIEFGSRIDKDDQTIARWEKKEDPLPKSVDLIVRILFANKFDSSLTIKELYNFHLGNTKLPEKILFSLESGNWTSEQVDSSQSVGRLRVELTTIMQQVISANVIGLPAENYSTQTFQENYKTTYIKAAH